MFHNKGVSLVELLVTLIVIAIFATLISPQLTIVLAEMEAKKVQSNLRTLIVHTKQQSYIYRNRLSICGSNDGIHCDPQGWSKQILVFKDNVVKNRLRESQEEIMQHLTLDLKYGELKWNGAGALNLVFHPDSGLPRGSNGTFKYCSKNSSKHFNVILSDMGHVRVEKTSTC